MNKPSENIYSKKYLTNYRLLSPKQESKRKKCKLENDEDLVQYSHSPVTQLEMSENISDCSIITEDFSSCISQESQSLQNVDNNLTVVQLKSEKRGCSNNILPGNKSKKIKPNCYELEEVNDTGDVTSDEAVDTSGSDEDKNDDINEDMETFNDLSEKISGFDPADDKWRAKVVAHDHDYYGSRVRFSNVTVWYFARHQYSCGVPSQGDVGLGMEMSHIHSEHHNINTLGDEYKLNDAKNKVKRKTKLGRLKPLTMSARMSLLRSHGIYQIDRKESQSIERLQV